MLKVSPGEARGATAAAIEAEDAARAAPRRRAQCRATGSCKDLVDMFDAKVVDSSVRANGDKN